MADKSEAHDGVFAAVAFVLLIPITIYSGFTLATLWGWFVVPAFGAPSLTTGTATGLLLVLGTVRARVDLSKSEPGAGVRGVVGLLLLAVMHSIALVLGAVIHAFQS